VAGETISWVTLVARLSLSLGNGGRDGVSERVRTGLVAGVGDGASIRQSRVAERLPTGFSGG
jgi:hypothetical protein